MGFWDTLGDIGKGFIDVGFPGISGVVGGKGVLGGTGGLLFGESGKTQYTPEPFNFGTTSLTPISGLRPEFLYRDTGRNRAIGELSSAQQRIAPRAQRPSETVQVSRFTPEKYGGATIDTSGYGQQMGAFAQRSRAAETSRSQLSGDIGLARSAALGRQPSVAEQQLQMGMEKQLAAQAAAAASARGGAGAQAAARRQAAIQGAETMAETNRQAAALRAEEMAQARGQLLAGGEALRAGDINQQGVQLTAAELALQPGLQQAQLAQQAGLQNQLLGTQTGMQQQALQTQAALQSQNLGTTTNIADLNAQLQTMGLNDQYSLGLLGRLGEMDRTRLMGTMGYAGMLSDQQLQERQQRINEQIARQRIMAGIAGSDAQAELMRSSSGLGFLGGMLGGMGAMSSG